MALITLLNELSNTKYKFKMYNIIVNRLFNMVDLNLSARNEKEQVGQWSIVEDFSNGNGMSFSLKTYC